MEKSTFLSAIFNSYVKLPEGKWTIVEDMVISQLPTFTAIEQILWPF